jgi:hypothetical protein
VAGLKIVASEHRAVSKGTLKGFVTLTLAGPGGFEITIRDCAWHENGGREYVLFPSVPVIKDERIVRDEKGKQVFKAPIISLGGDRDYRDKLQAAMVRAIYRLVGGGEQPEAGASNVSPFA